MAYVDAEVRKMRSFEEGKGNKSKNKYSHKDMVDMIWEVGVECNRLTGEVVTSQIQRRQTREIANFLWHG